MKQENRTELVENKRKAAGKPAANVLPQLGLNQRHFD